MKKFLALITLVWFTLFSSAQEERVNFATSSFDVNYFYGNVANHNANALIFIANHPEGVLLRWNKKTFGEKPWQESFNYPDWGLSFSFENFKNDYLGKSYALYGHYNFYLLKRHLMLSMGQGIAYATAPYNAQSNSRNVAYSTHILASTFAMLNYRKERLFKSPFGIQAGVLLIHYSNGKIKSPNAGANTVAANIGLTYNMGEENNAYIKSKKNNHFYKQSLGYNIALRTGVNQSGLIGSDQYMFYIPVFYIDKRIGKINALQVGTEIFFSNFLKEDIRYNAIAYPEKNVAIDTDYKRVGVFIGHELFIDNFSVETQLGYYLYYPYEFEKRIYFRAGLKKYIGEKIYGLLSLKAHGAKAEAVEFGLGLHLGGKEKNKDDD